jgi:hypothetical protein
VMRRSIASAWQRCSIGNSRARGNAARLVTRERVATLLDW